MSFVLLSSVEHLLWHEQPGVRLFRLFAPRAWLTPNHYIRFYLVPILYHASQFSNHCFGHDVNLAPINRNLVTAYRLHVFYLASVSGFWKDTVPQETKQTGIQNYYGMFNRVWGIISTWMCVFITVKFSLHRSLRVYSVSFILESWETYQISATSIFCLHHSMTDWWWPIFNALLNV